jgi:RND family efflux transporter MFP subunit
VEVHRFRRDFLISSRAGADLPTRPAPLLSRLGHQLEHKTPHSANTTNVVFSRLPSVVAQKHRIAGCFLVRLQLQVVGSEQTSSRKHSRNSSRRDLATGLQPGCKAFWDPNVNKVFTTKRLIAGTLCLLVIGLIVAAVRPYKHTMGASPAVPPEVEVAEVKQRDVPIYREWIGTLDGFVNADVRAQVTGYLMKQGYQEGSFVRQGQLLFQIDPRPFQAALDQAQGQLAQAEASLANADAVQGRTQLDVQRYTPLAKEQAASQQDLDNAVQNNLAAIATVATAKAQIKTYKAAVETANINLDFTRLVAPIDGIAGQALLQVGALVTPGSGIVTSVSTLDPIKVYFTVGEPQYLAWRKRFPTEESRIEADKSLKLQLILADGSIYAREGTFYFADRQVDVSTGAIRIAGLFPNPGNILRPGGYAKVRAVIATERDALLVPQRAVSELQGGYQLAVLDADNKVTIRSVAIGDTVGNERIIVDGVHTGERVVAEGIQKVRPGVQVNPKPFAEQTKGN